MPRRHDPLNLRSVEAQAATTAGVVSLSALRAANITRWQREAQVGARRWVAVSRRGIVTTTGVPHGEAAIRISLLRVGPTAALGGVTALQWRGLTGFDERRGLHLWVRKSGFKTRCPGVVLHETRRWTEDDVDSAGIRHSHPTAATVQAALWAGSARQATLLLTMAVQQRIVRADDLVDPFSAVRRHPYRAVLLAVLGDVRGGVHSLNELDFARMCRDHGLPEPDRQVRRQSSQGRVHLDVYWDRFGVAVEVDGAGHGVLTQAMSDEIRSLDLQAAGDAAVQVSSVTLRIAPAPFFAALARLLRARGWGG
ncbi:hypothetical protein V3N99_09810 [Dermatophilaceae bacterium Soc4.6]